VNNKKIWDLIIAFQHKDEFISSFQKWKYTDEKDLMKKSMELYCVKENDDLIPVQMTLSIAEIKNKRFICVYITDISERIAANEEIEKLIEEMQVSKEVIENNASELVMLNSKLHESEEQLKELNASKDKFFSIIAHDLKSPFQSLLGYSEILSKEIETLEKDDIKSFANDLHKSSEKLFKLLENLLAWSRLQRGVMEYNPDNYQLAELIMGNIEIADFKAKDKNIELKYEIDFDIWIYCDYNMINTVLRNLISNSVKFTKSGGEISIDKIIDENITIIVKDNGVGMSENAMKKIFQIDQHHSTLGTNNEQGTGLGLILCKELVEKNHGSIRVESQEGVGTTFYITLPKGSYPKFDEEI
jgi:signal transduction histidine kinase